MKYKTWKDIPAKAELKVMPCCDMILLAENLFPKWRKPRLTSYNFTIGYMPYGYSFRVVNSWHKWLDKGYAFQFGTHKVIDDCIREFLNYVRDNKINVKKLWEE